MRFSPERERNPDRSREAILDAAEHLFAERGYEGTSLQEVGARAGVSRGTPSYFFRSKAELYRSVLERCFAQVQNAVRTGRERAIASGEAPDVVLAGVVGDYFDFIASRPNFIRLVEWEALSGGEHLRDLPPHLRVVQEAVTVLADEMGFGPEQRAEAMQLTLSIIALCWFPFVHAGTVVSAMGADLGDQCFRDTRRQHVIELVLSGMRLRLPMVAATSSTRSET